MVKKIFFLLFAAFVQYSYGQKKIEKVPDLVPVKDSYILTGKLDSSQYFYFLNGILKEQFDERRRKLASAIQSKESLLLHLERIKNDYKNLLGPVPEKTRLNPVITGRIEKDGYSIEKVAFESRPDHHVTALLYIPRGNGPFPAILHMPGHSATSKGRDYYQRIGKNFALNGFVVLQTDPVCQGERCQICQDMQNHSDIYGNPMDQSTTGQHELYNEKLLLLGSGMVAWEAWDNIRSLDYLCSRKEVDSTRIGVTGLSGGGTQTTYLASLDPRIKVAAPSSYIATTEEKFRTIGSQDGCQQLYSEGKLGMEEQDFLFMAAPIPIMILSTYGDFFSYHGSETAVSELARMYDVLGVKERIRHFSTGGEHGMTYASISADVKWMSWWLKGDSSGIVCDTLTTDFLPLEDTYVTETGQVLTYFRNEKSVLDYAREMSEQCKASRKDFLAASTYESLAKMSSALIGFENVGMISGGIRKNSFTWEGLVIEKHLIRRDKGFFLPAYIIKPAKSRKGNSPAIILSGCFGKVNELNSNKELVLHKLGEGYSVMVVDVTNTGELRTPEDGRTMSYEFAIAKLPVYAGKTLLGYRAEDLIIARNYLKSLIKCRNIELLASDQTGPCAIHAAFIDGGFSKLFLKNSPDSWESLVKTHFTPDNIGIIVPGVLKYYDLPEMLNMLNIMHKTSVEIIN